MTDVNEKVIELIENGEKENLLPELVHSFGTFCMDSDSIDEGVERALDYFAITPEEV